MDYFFGVLNLDYWYFYSNSEYEPGPGLGMRCVLLKYVAFSLLKGKPCGVNVVLILYSAGPGLARVLKWSLFACENENLGNSLVPL